MEGLGPGSHRLLLARAAGGQEDKQGKLKFNNNTTLMPPVLPEMKECVYIQNVANNIYMMNCSGGNSFEARVISVAGLKKKKVTCRDDLIPDCEGALTCV